MNIKAIVRAEPKPEPLAYSIRDAAALLGLSYMSVYRLIRAHKIKTVSIFRKPVITRIELEKFLLEHTGAHVVRTPRRTK